MVDMISDNRIDFRAAVNFFAERKVCLQPQRLHIHLPNANKVLDAGLRHFWAVTTCGSPNTTRWRTG